MVGMNETALQLESDKTVLVEEVQGLVFGKARVQNWPWPDFAQRRRMKMVWVAVGYVEMFGATNQIDLVFGRIFLQPPATPVD